MAKQVTQFVAASGTSYNTEHAAWLDDLHGFFTGAGMSEGVAHNLVRHIDDSNTTHRLGEILHGLETSRAAPTIAELVASGHLADLKVAPRLEISPVGMDAASVPDDAWKLVNMRPLISNPAVTIEPKGDVGRRSCVVGPPNSVAVRYSDPATVKP